MTEFFSSIVSWYMGHINYWTITLLMAIESSFIPFPSEIVLPPAAWKAADGQLNLIGIFLAGTTGAMIGALFNYFFALTLGRKVLYKLADTRLAHLLLIKKESLIKAEQYFNKYGKSSTLIGRLVPAIRQLISLPAGIARMNMRSFLLFTFIGASLWNSVLLVLGYTLHSQKEKLEPYYQMISMVCLGGGVLFVAFIIIKTVISGKNKSKVNIPQTSPDKDAEKVA